MFILFQIAGACFLVKTVYVDRKELASILKRVIRKPMEEPGGTWIIAYTFSFIVGGVICGCGFGLTPLFVLLGITVSIGLVYVVYHLLIFLHGLLMFTTMRDIKLFVRELFSKEMLKFVICFGSPFLMGYFLKNIGAYADVHVPEMILWLVKVVLYLAAVLNVFLPFILLTYYDSILEKLAAYMPTLADKN